jgi:hypothetical protein
MRTCVALTHPFQLRGKIATQVTHVPPRDRLGQIEWLHDV